MGSKGSQTSTSTSSTSPDPQAYQAYSNLLKQASGVAATPYQSYTGELTAPVNAQQTAGINNINSNAGFAQPYIQQAAGYANNAAQPITGQQIQQYSDPYTQQVIQATQAQFNNQNAQQQQQLTGNAIAQGALGGNRVGVAQANLAGQQQLAQAPVIAGLQSQGYQTGLNTALSQQQAQAQAAYSLGNLGVAGQNAALTGAGAQVGAGTLQQGTQQAQDTAAYNQFLQSLAYPFQTTQWLAGIDTGVGSQMGGTSSGTQTQPAPNPLSSILGGLLGVGSLFIPTKKDGGRVPSFDQGGGIGGTPYAGVAGWVPSIGISAGHGAPGAPQMGGQKQNAGFDPSAMLKQAQQTAGFAGALKNKFGSSPLDITPPGVGASFGDSGSYDYFGGPDSGLGALYADGGVVEAPGNFDDGGGVGGFAPVQFDDFADASQAPIMLPSAYDPRALSPVVNGPAIAQSSPVGGFAPTPDQAAPKGDIAPVAGQSAPGLGAPIDVPQNLGDAGTGVNVPMAPHAAAPAAGFAPADDAQPRVDPIAHYAHAIGSIESSNNYSAVTDTGKGDAAYGRYQVTGANIPVWTKQVLGTAMTPQQFLHDPSAQDAVFKAKFGQYVAQTGNPDDAASMWFSGRPMAQAGNVTDVLGTSVPDYVRKFRQALTGSAGAQYADNGMNGDRLPANATPTQGVIPGFAPHPDGAESSNPFAVSPAVKTALLATGLGMMASRSPFLGQAIGEGGLEGLKTYSSQSAAQQKSGIENKRVDLEAQRLSQVADKASQDLALRTKAQADTAQYHQGLLERQALQMAGTDADGNPVYIDTRTGQKVVGPTGLKTVGRATGITMDDPTAQFLADRVRAGDTRALVGLGRGAQGAQNLTKIQAIVARDAAAGKPVDPAAQQIMDNASEQTGYTSSQRTFGTQTAKMAVNTNEAAGAINLGRQASAAVPRTNWVPVNKAIQAYQSGTSDPTLARFGAANLAIINTYARAISPTGVPTVNDKQHAEHLLTTASGPDAYNAVLDQMEQEINIAHNAAPAAKKELQNLRKGAPTAIAAPVAAPAPVPASPAQRQVGTTYMTPKGPAKWMGNGWQAVQ